MDDNELNYLLRYKHFELITKSGKLKKIREIVKWFLKNIKHSLKLLSDPTEILLNNKPRHLDRDFWENGNSNSLIV